MLFCVLVIFAAPVKATQERDLQDIFPVQDANLVEPPFTPEAVRAATVRGRCPVPVLWWVRSNQNMLPRQCKPQKNEQATFSLYPTLDKVQPMSLLIEWQVLARDKIQFRCTGPITLIYPDNHQLIHTYRFTAKPEQDIQAVTMYFTVYGWTNLLWNASSTCIKNP